MSHDVFISYASNDEATASKIREALESEEIRCWIAPRNVPAGSSYAAEIVGAIEAAKLVVLVLSPHAVNSQHVRREVRQASEREGPPLPILPFRVEAVKLDREFNYLLGGYHFLDASQAPFEEKLPQLIRDIKKFLGGGERLPVVRSPIEQPPIEVPTPVKEGAKPGEGEHIADTPAPEAPPAGGPTPEPLAPEALVTFETVHDEELAQIRLRRRVIYTSERERPGRPPVRPSFAPPRPPESGAAADEVEKARRVGALDQHLAGLALSGGGIRSATFAVGLLQALAQLRLLTRFDYLSTVSGGGYAGSWLAAWLKREGDVLGVQDQLDPGRVSQRAADRVEIGPGRIVDEEPGPLHHLRAYSNYLAPWKGALTADTWTLLAIYARNTLINFFLLLPLTLGFVLLAWMLVKFFDAPAAPAGRAPTAAFLGFVSLLGAAFYLIGTQLAMLRNARRAAKDRLESADQMQLIIRKDLVYWIIGFLVLAAVLGCWCFALNPADMARTRLPGWFRAAREARLAGPLLGSVIEYMAMFATLLVITNLAGYVAYRATIVGGADGRGPGGGPAGFARGALALLCILIITGASGGALFYGLVTWVLWPLSGQPWAIATIGPPLVILVIFVAVTVAVWLLARWQDEYIREWWAQVCARLLLAGVAWLGIMAILFYVRPLVRHLNWLASSMLTPALVAGWVATSVGGVMAGRSPRTDGRSAGHPLLDFLGRIAPPVFLIGLLAVISDLAGLLVGARPPAPADLPALAQALGVGAVGGGPGGLAATAVTAAPASSTLSGAVAAFGMQVAGVPFDRLAGWLGISAVAVLVAGFLVSDANLFSLHNLYGNRLVRCYLGASRPKRSWRERSSAGGRTFRVAESQLADLWRRTSQAARAWLPGPGGAPTESGGPDRSADLAGRLPRRLDPARIRQENRVTGFDPDDDFPLRALGIGPDDLADSPGPPYYGPYPLINTALNLVAGQELAWQDRKGESFTFTPRFCGSRDTWYRRLAENSDRNLTLGQAVAISGAAADPNMGTSSSAPLRALMTIFNARLGWWLQNPRYNDWRFWINALPAGLARRLVRGPLRNDWAGRGPGIAWPIVRELLGLTDERSSYVHLSDGGHFENLAVYELIRRRCRYIVVSDAGMDPAYAFEDLARLIRLCRIDFGIRIEIDVSALRPAAGGPSRWHCAIGRIRYDDVDGGEIPGTLIYLKASLTGDEPPDVQNYRALHPEFPHQTTGDQFFDEDQFESYRMLGLHVGLTVFREAAHELRQELWAESQPELEFIRGNRRLFSALSRRWASAPPTPAEFVSSADAWVKLQGDLRDQEDLDRLSRDIYPELGEGAGGRAELHAVAQMLQVMEDAWLRLDLGGPDRVPLNRGWMSVFRRWASTAALHRHWPTLRAEYGEDFIRFCESQLRLGVVADLIPVEEAGAPDPLAERALHALAPEFAREWPGRSLRRVIEAARDSWTDPADRPPWMWVLVQGPEGTPRNSPDRIPIGIAAARHLDDSGARLRLQTAADRGGLPDHGTDLVVVADVAGVLHVRIFDAHGTRVVDTREPWLPPEQAPKVQALRAQLQDLWARPSLTPDETARALAAVAAIVGPRVEIFVWLRRPYRSMGIGGRYASALLGSFCLALWAKGRSPITLQVTYPARHPRGEGPHPPAAPRESDPEFHLWRNFFSIFDFRSEPRDRVFSPDEDVILQRTFDPPQQ